MTEPPPEGGCCRCIISFTITSGFTALFMWLSLKTYNPTCSIEQFYVFALNKTTNNTHPHPHPHPHPPTNTTIHYDLKLNNKNNNDKGIYYDALNLTFYYKPNLSFPIGSGYYNGFYQGHGKSTHRVGDVNMSRSGVEAVSRNGSATVYMFRVMLETRMRFKIVFWKTKRHRLVIGADLLVDDQGRLVKRKKNKGITLSSGAAAMISKGWFKLFISLISVLIVVLRS